MRFQVFSLKPNYPRFHQRKEGRCINKWHLSRILLQLLHCVKVSIIFRAELGCGKNHTFCVASAAMQMLGNSSVRKLRVKQLSSILLNHNHRTSPRINKQSYNPHLCQEQFNPHLDLPCGGCRIAEVTREHDPGSVKAA